MKVTKKELRQILTDRLMGYTTQIWLIPGLVNEIMITLEEYKVFSKVKKTKVQDKDFRTI